jgi:hypothetical protein
MSRIDEERRKVLDRREACIPQLRALRDRWEVELRALTGHSRFGNRYSVHRWEQEEAGRFVAGLSLLPQTTIFVPRHPSIGDCLRLEHSCEYFKHSRLDLYMAMKPDYCGEKRLFWGDELPAPGSAVVRTPVAKWIARDLVARDVQGAAGAPLS